jgi:transposase
LVKKTGRTSASTFLEALIAAVPYKIHTVLTVNGIQFTFPLRYAAGPKSASSFTFAKASWTPTLPDWIDGHVSALAVIGGVPRLLVPDNTKSAVVRACFHDP